MKGPMLRLARPALRLLRVRANEDSIRVGASKVRGLPDLPPGFRWPTGAECRACYIDITRGADRPAGFLAQINLGEIADTHAARELPKAGLLSFFCFQDLEDNEIGVWATLFPDVTGLVRTRPPGELTEGNAHVPPSRLMFAETLDLPVGWKSPWSEELRPDPETDYDKVLDHYYSSNFENILGYARSTSGPDPTGTKESRHLILLKTAVGSRVHIHLNQADLTAGNFGAITLNWVDWD